MEKEAASSGDTVQITVHIPPKCTRCRRPSGVYGVQVRAEGTG